MLLLWLEKSDAMKYAFHYLVVIFFISSSLADAQTDVKISKKEFRNGKTGFEAAWTSVTAGDQFYKEKGIGYGNAFDAYLKATQYNSMNPELNYRTGISALFSDNKEKAAKYFQKVLEVNPGLTEDLLFFTGRALQYTGRYGEAIEKYNNYISSAGKKQSANVSAAKRHIEESISADNIVKDTLSIEIKNIGSGINSSADEYSGLLTSDGNTMFFASRRELDKSSTLNDNRFDENIFFSTKVNGSWGIAASPGRNLTTKYCETPVYINSAGDELYIYAGYENGGDIKVSDKRKGDWKRPKPIPFNINTGGLETSFIISPAGDEVWFVTDGRKDGLGGRDIYMIRKISEKRWSKPVNAGPSFNTSYDEESIKFSNGGDTLWFASKGHNSIGGFDIFYCVKDNNGTWTSAVNLGYPINTPWDEIFFFPVKGNDSLFYFASNRPESMGGLDIFEGRILPPEPVVTLPPPPKPDTVVVRDTIILVKEIVQAPPAPVLQEPPKETGLYLIGKTTDSETGGPVMAKIEIIDFSTDAIIASTASSDVDGSYRVKLPAKKTYMVDFRAAGFLSDMKRIDINESYSGEAYNLDLPMIKVKVGKKVVLNNILFETGKSVLTQSSFTELERLVSILQENATMKIEISGHTDKTGSEQLNFKLSEARAKAVVDYLIQKGIGQARLEYKGFGSLQPIADNATAEGRSKNRRVEFKILEF